MKPLLLVAFSLAAALPVKADRADDYLKIEMEKRRIPGAALLVVQDGKTVKSAAYGLANLELSVPVRLDTVFEIGSVSKQFTAAGILLLAQEGRLHVEDPIGNYLAHLPDVWTNITVRHLLTHTSGLKNYTSLEGFELTKHLTETQFVKAIAVQSPEFQPGISWKYCNTGFNLLGFIIENLSGTNYWAFMQQRIFGPLGMNATADRRPGVIITNRAAGYEQTNHLHINRDYDLTDVFSAGAIVSTVGDLAKWNAALDRDDLLNAASKRQMWTRVTLAGGKQANYGFGWFLDRVEGRENIGHSGATSGFSASLQRFPEDKLAVILLTNTDEQIATVLARKIATFYFSQK